MHHLRCVAAVTLSLASLSACANDFGNATNLPIQSLPSDGTTADTPADANNTYNRDEDVNYLLLLGETALRQGNYSEAVDKYSAAALRSDDVGIAKRAMNLALQYGDPEDNRQQSGALAIHLLTLAPNSVQALQAATLYYLGELDTDAAIATAEQFLLLDTSARNSNNSFGDSDNNDQENSDIDNLASIIIPEPLGERMLIVGSWLARTEADTSHLQFALQLAQRYPQLAEAHYVYGVELLRANDPTEAALEAETAVRLRKGWEKPRILQAQAAIAQGKPEAASTILQQAIKRAPRNTGLRLEYALLLAQQNQLDEASSQYLQILGYEQNQPQALAALGRIAIAQDDPETARRYFQQLAESAQFKDRAALWLGRLAESQGSIAEALTWYLQVRGNESFTALLQVGRLLYQNNQAERGARHFDRLREVFTQQTPKLNAIQAELASEYIPGEVAKTQINQLLEKDPDNPELLYARGMTQEKLGEHEAAWQDYARVTLLQPDNAQAFNAWGYSLTINTTRYVEAERLLDKAIELAPDSPAIQDSKGWLLFKQNQAEAALPLLQQAWSAFRHSEVAAHLGEVLWSLEQPAAAKDVWQQGIELNDDQTVLKETLQRLGITLDNPAEPIEPAALPDVTPIP